MVSELSCLETLIWVVLFLTGFLSTAGVSVSALCGRIFWTLSAAQLVVIITSALVTCSTNGSCPSI
ncbi:hypothetical protein ASG58_21405 [Rhizobium sp. Leaf383]|nr:hypothetical protein ASG58_21405 [Rhizobium sp. Leaf383]